VGDPGDGRLGVELRAVLGALTAAQVEVLLLSAWEGLSGAGLATALGWSPVAARVRLHRARRALTAAFTAADSPPAAVLAPPTPHPNSTSTLDFGSDRSGVTR